jgi:hypothetical protein
MGPSSYMQSVVDWNVVMRRMIVLVMQTKVMDCMINCWIMWILGSRNVSDVRCGFWSYGFIVDRAMKVEHNIQSSFILRPHLATVCVDLGEGMWHYMAKWYLRNSWFQTFAAFWMLYAFFWVIPWRLNFIYWRFRSLCLFHLRMPTKMEQTVFENVTV